MLMSPVRCATHASRVARALAAARCSTTTAAWSQQHEYLDAGLVVEAIFQVVQHWFYNCSGFLQTPELGQTHGTRGGPDHKPGLAAASRRQACRRGLFLGRGEPDIRSPHGAALGQSAA
jgi:hypothetical protein